MHAQLASLAHASVLQLRDAIRRATATHVPADGRDGKRFLDSVVVKDSTWDEWEETAFDVQQILPDAAPTQRSESPPRGKRMEWSTSDTISVVSALAALASAAYAHKTYRATVDLKKHDFCLELQRANETLRAAVGDLPELLGRANRSRRGANSNRGLNGGSVWLEWAKRVDQLEAEISAIRQRLPREEHFEQLPFEDLTRLITATHALQGRADAVESELRDALREDERYFDHLREDYRAESAALLSQPLKRKLGD